MLSPFSTDVFKDADQVVGHAIQALQRGAYADPEVAAIVAANAFFHHVAVNRARQQLAQQFEVFRQVIGVGDVLEGHAIQLVGAVAEQFAEAAIDSLPAAIQADIGQGAPGQFEDGAKAFFAITQRFFGAHAFGVVHADANHLYWSADGILHYRCPRGDPAQFAIRLEDAKVEFAAAALGDDPVVHGLHGRNIFWRKMAPEVLVGRDRPAIHNLDVG
ncbi:hypothetical protein D9M71_458540 [compost metagenome]